MNNQQATVTSGDNSAVIANQMPVDAAGIEAKSDVIETRFGKITVNRDNPIAFQKGLLGMFNVFMLFMLFSYANIIFWTYVYLSKIINDKIMIVIHRFT